MNEAITPRAPRQNRPSLISANIIRVYFTNPDGRKVYALQNRFGSYKEQLKAEQALAQAEENYEHQREVEG